jgi:CRP-like cAMP-binding protein
MVCCGAARLAAPSSQREDTMSFIPDLDAFKKSLAALPVKTFEAGQTVIAAGSATGQLFILKQGLVEVVKDGQQIAKISEPGAVFGELALILDKPHTADVKTLERSDFHVVKASSLLTENVSALLYVSAILAKRLDAANDLIVEIKGELAEENRPGVIRKALDKLGELLGPSGNNNPDYYFYYPMY